MNKNKNEYKDNYRAVIKAIQHALVMYSWDGYTRLYLSKENGLEGIEVAKVKDILTSLADEGVLRIFRDIKMSDFIRNSSPASELIYPDTQSKHRRVLENHFLLIINKLSFKNLLSIYGSPLFLLSLIPKNKKYKYISRIAVPLVKDFGEEIENYKLAVCFNSKLLKGDFLKNDVTSEKYNNKIENCLKTMKKLLMPYGYTIKFNQRNTKLVKI